MPEERKVYRRPARTAAPAPQAGQAAPRPDAPPAAEEKRNVPAPNAAAAALCWGCVCSACWSWSLCRWCWCAARQRRKALPRRTSARPPRPGRRTIWATTSTQAAGPCPPRCSRVWTYPSSRARSTGEKAKAAGIDFAIIRCGFGGEWDGQEENWAQDDPQWRRNADECTRLGIPFGAYLYSYATTVEEARSEADHVARLLGLTAPPQEGLDDYTAAPLSAELPGLLRPRG